MLQMAETAPVVLIGENSPEHVAHRLMHEVARIERKAFYHHPEAGWQTADRKYILDTYAECLQAVLGHR
jgi:hypothetical protein